MRFNLSLLGGKKNKKDALLDQSLVIECNEVESLVVLILISMIQITKD